MYQRVGFFGQLPQDGVAQRCANKVDVAVQARVRAPSNPRYRVPGSDELPGNQPPERAGGVGNQDVHLGLTSRYVTSNNRQVGMTYATVGL